MKHATHSEHDAAYAWLEAHQSAAMCSESAGQIARPNDYKVMCDKEIKIESAKVQKCKPEIQSK